MYQSSLERAEQFIDQYSLECIFSCVSGVGAALAFSGGLYGRGMVMLGFIPMVWFKEIIDYFTPRRVVSENNIVRQVGLKLAEARGKGKLEEGTVHNALVGHRERVETEGGLYNLYEKYDYILLNFNQIEEFARQHLPQFNLIVVNKYGMYCSNPEGEVDVPVRVRDQFWIDSPTANTMVELFY